jgi:F-type H+-transporting ATPase subunit c
MAGEGLQAVIEGTDWSSWTVAGRYLAASIAMGLGAIGAGVGEGYNAGEAADASARQPSAGPDLVRAMLVGQAVAETSGIFALVVAALLLFVPPPGPCMEVTGACLGAGMAMGLGALGSGVGCGIAGGRAAAGIGRNPRVRGDVTITMLLGQALASSPAVLALVVSVVLLFAQPMGYYRGSSFVLAAAAMSAGLCVGAGAIGPGFGAGTAAAGACDAVSRTPEARTAITRVMLVGGAVSQSTSVYAFVTAFVLIFLVRA